MPNAKSQENLPAGLRAEIDAALGFVPSFAATFSAKEARLWWNHMRDVRLSSKTVLSGKNQQLVELGTAAQIPCQYCIMFHTEAARRNGATASEIQEALYVASMRRQWSTILSTSSAPYTAFDRELNQLVAYVKTQLNFGSTIRAGRGPMKFSQFVGNPRTNLTAIAGR